MKRIIIVALLITGIAQAQTTHRKIALVIAISNYPEETGWPSISCNRDIQLIKPVMEREGFTEVRLLTDKEATHDGIVSAFKKLEIESRTGDIIYIHYSGHGQQIADDNGDEPDGLDESLVCYGAPSEYKPGYKGEKHLRDDELGVLIDGLRMKIGPTGQVLATMDCCYSGTITRGVAKIRGGKPPIVPPGFITLSGVPEKESELVSSPARFRGIESKPAPFIVFSAASFDEPNSETFDDNGVGVGSLSFAVAKALTKCDSGFTYRGLYSEVLAIMNQKVPQQTPMVEGDLDYTLFGGNYVKQQKFFSVKEIKNETELVMNVGKMANMYEHTQVMLMPINSIQADESKMMASGEIIHSDYFTSTVRLNKPLKLNDKNDAWIFVTEQSSGDVHLKISVKGFNNAEEEKKFLNELAAVSLFTIVNIAPDVLVEKGTGTNKNFVYIRYAGDGLVTDSISLASDHWIGSVQESLKHLAQSRFLKNFDMQSADKNIRFELLLLKQTAMGTDTLKTSDLVATFIPGQTALLRIENLSNQRLYFNIIDIQPDGIINPLFPRPEEQTLKHAEQYYVEPMQSKILPGTISFSPPFGTEVFKLFASDEAFNLTPIIGSQGAGTRGVHKPLEQLFQNTYSTTRGVTYAMKSENTIATFNYVFKINMK